MALPTPTQFRQKCVAVFLADEAMRSGKTVAAVDAQVEAAANAVVAKFRALLDAAPHNDDGAVYLRPIACHFENVPAAAVANLFHLVCCKLCTIVEPYGWKINPSTLHDGTRCVRFAPIPAPRCGCVRTHAAATCLAMPIYE